MSFQKRHVWGIFLPVILFFGVFITNQFLSIGNFPFPQSKIKELILGVLLGQLIFGISRLDWFKNRAVLLKLRILVIVIVLLWGGMKFLNTLAPTNLFNQEKMIFPSVQFLNHLFWTALFLGVLILSVWIFITLKGLVYVQQGKKTNRNFFLLLIFIFLQMIYVLFGGKGKEIVQSVWNWQYSKLMLENLFFSFVVFFSFINGFRCKWIHYFTKRDKVEAFFLGLLCYPCLLFLFLDTSQIVQNYSVVMKAFTRCLFMFQIIYISMALLGILLQLPSAGLMDRRMKEIHSFQALSETLSSVFDIQELVKKTTELSLQIVNADFSWLELKESSTYNLVSTYGIDSEEVKQIPSSIRKTIRKEVVGGKEALLINDLFKDRRIRETDEWKPKAGSLLAAQVQRKKKELGILYALKSETFGFVDESRGLFQAFADQVAVALDNVRLVEVTIEQERYREELRLAHQAQMRLLPQEMPRIKGMGLGGFCMTANDIGGDFYDVITVNKNRVDVVIGDVSGKGASAAFYMAELKGIIQSLAPHFSSPKDILIEMNTLLCKNFESNTFVTMAYGILLPLKKQIQLVRAGHPPVGLIRKNAVSWLETKGLGLGLTSSDFLGRTLEEKILRLKNGDTVIFYTDGLVEARNAQGEEYGEENLTETLSNLQGSEPDELLEEVRRRMLKFTKDVPRHDDMTLLVLRVLAL